MVEEQLRRISISRNQSLEAAFDTLLHELSHALAFHLAEPRDVEERAWTNATVWAELLKQFEARGGTAGVMRTLAEILGIESPADDPASTRLAVDRARREVLSVGLTSAQWDQFLSICDRAGLSVDLGECYPMALQLGDESEPGVACVTRIDLLRRAAGALGDYEGQQECSWCDAEGKWTDVWLHNEAPAAARVGIRHDNGQITTAVVKAETFKTSGWEKVDLVLAWCAEAWALRKAFPALAGVFIREEVEALSRDSSGDAR